LVAVLGRPDTDAVVGPGRIGQHLPPLELGDARLVAADPEGELAAPWIVGDRVYDFSLVSSSSRPATLAAVRVAQSDDGFEAAPRRDASRSGRLITAVPNPVPRGEGIGTTTVAWASGDVRDAQVVVADGAPELFFPADGAEAAGHLTQASSLGVEYLLVADSERWWLDHYPELRATLDECPVAVCEGPCIVYDIRFVDR
jgi:hypothetical protein